MSLADENHHQQADFWSNGSSDVPVVVKPQPPPDPAWLVCWLILLFEYLSFKVVHYSRLHH